MPKETTQRGTGPSTTAEIWEPTPEGGMLHRAERVAVVADLHLGYEWARGAAGDCVPPHSLAEAVARLEKLLDRAPIATLIVAGDLVESHRPCRRTEADLRRLADWLELRGVRMVLLRGNHDRTRPEAPDCLVVDGWTIAHGHRPIEGDRTISGHFHPVLRVEGISAPCFLIGPDRIILPAFSANAAGCDVRTAAIPRDWLQAGLRCLASTGDDLLDFGPLAGLRTGRR